MLWSSPLPPADVAAAMSFVELLRPIAALALVSVAAGFAVLLGGIVQDLRAHRGPGASPTPAVPGRSPAAPVGRAA